VGPPSVLAGGPPRKGLLLFCGHPLFMSIRENERLNRVNLDMEASRADSLLVSHLPNVFYLCGFTGSNASLLIQPGAMHLFTDGRYTVQARQEALGATVHIGRQSPSMQAAEWILKRKGSRRVRLGFDPAHISYAEWTRLQKTLGKRVSWKPLPGLVEALREIKSPQELEVMREAAKLGSEVMQEVISLVKPGVSELDLAAEADYRMRRKGASGPSFDTIIASGERSALPHARPTDKLVRKNELVVIDLGVILRHYCSDLTRTVYVGRAPARVRQWYGAVLAAKQAALLALRAGQPAGQIDRAARKVLERSGLGRFFTHSTGHGLGIEVHEGPRLGRGQKQEICAGNVVTLEPGIYVDGVGGIRIEDDVAVHANATEVLTSAPTELLEI
jgi:Xaa-Pro aminopeptidase